MKLDTTFCSGVDSEALAKYFNNLVNKVFKMLPIYENHEQSLDTYVDSLQCEIEGCRELVVVLQDDPLYISLLSSLAWLRNHFDDEQCEFERIRRMVFNSIDLCKKLERQTRNLKEGGAES